MIRLFFILSILVTICAFSPSYAGDNTLKVLTINVWSGLDYNGIFKMGEYETRDRRKARFRSLVAQVKKLSPDVIFVQEANPVGGYAANLASVLGMDEIHQVVNAGIKIGSLGIPVNLKEGLVILARKDLSLQKVAAWKLSGSPGIHTDLFTCHLDEAVLVLAGRISFTGQVVNLVNVHLAAAPRIPADIKKFRDELLAGGEMSEEEFAKGLEEWRRREARRLMEVKRLIGHLEQSCLDIPCIVAGDFNAEPDAVEMTLFREKGGFIDVLEVEKGGLSAVERNFTWDVELNMNTAPSKRSTDARGKAREEFDRLAAAAGFRSRRLDYIFIGKNFPTKSVLNSRVVISEQVKGALASDHFGVLAEVILETGGIHRGNGFDPVGETGVPEERDR